MLQARMHTITITLYVVRQAQSFCQRRVTVGRGCDSWRVTEHQSRTFFSGPTPAPNPLTFIALAEWKIDTHNCGWNIFLAPTIEIPVLGILACDYCQTPTARRANGLGADLTPLMPGSWRLWQVLSLNSGSHTWMNSSRNLESCNWGIRYIVIQELILLTIFVYAR